MERESENPHSLSFQFELCNCRDGEVIFEKELSYNYSYFELRNLGTLVPKLQLPL